MPFPRKFRRCLSDRLLLIVLYSHLYAVKRFAGVREMVRDRAVDEDNPSADGSLCKCG
jgi:hypothetical protein